MTDSSPGPLRPVRLVLLVIACGVIGMIVALFDQSETFRRERRLPPAEPAPVVTTGGPEAG